MVLSVDRISHVTTLKLHSMSFALPFGGTVPLNVVAGHARTVLRLSLLDIPGL